MVNGVSGTRMNQPVGARFIAPAASDAESLARRGMGRGVGERGRDESRPYNGPDQRGALLSNASLYGEVVDYAEEWFYILTDEWIL
jgi:hypothetical protein